MILNGMMDIRDNTPIKITTFRYREGNIPPVFP